jgi:putative phosphoesterase
MRIAVLADTHAPRRWKGCPPAVANELVAADVILHAGDACTAEMLDEIVAFAPVHAVLGNNDGPDVVAWGAPEHLELDLEGLRVAMVHDSGPAKGRAPRLRRTFPGADLVVFGHSHIPWNADEQGQRAFNPGSPTDRRRQPRGTMGRLEIRRGRLISAEIVAVTA